jgi:phosphatidylglycerophosphatase A
MTIVADPRDVSDVSDATILRDDAAAPAALLTSLTSRASATFMRAHPARWIALGFGSGLSPWAPGTVGTLWAWVAFLVLDRWLGPVGWAFVIGASLPLGVWACARTAHELALADPGVIVWDEIVAFWIVLWLVMPAGLLAQTIAFALFRFFDAVKPGPVGWCDRRFKRARGWMQGVGIIADDLVAALCTLLVIALWTFAFR